MISFNKKNFGVLLMKQAYITLVGRSAWAVVNSYYFMIQKGKCDPDLVLVFVEELFEDKLDWIIEGITVVNEAFGVDATIETNLVGNARYVPSGVEVSHRLKQLKEDGFEICLDVTPGRKALVAASLISAYKTGIDHVFYLAVDEIRDIPLLMKPKNTFHFRDFMTEVRREMDD
jgi:hypothetical protein